LEVDNLFPEINITPLQDLDEAYASTISAFEDSGLKVYQPDYLNSIINAREFTRIFNVYKDEVKHTFFIFTTQLDEDKVNQVLNSFSQPNDKSLVYFISAYPLPGILNFIGKNSPAAFFELEAVRNLKKLEKLASEPGLVSDYSNIMKNLAKKYFDLDIGYDIPQSLKNMEKAIINFFREGKDYDMIYEFEIDYFPHYSMLLFSIYLSDLLIQNFKGELFYTAEQNIKELGIGFSLGDNDFIEIQAHPVEKVFNFFFEGKDSSIINWYYELKYHLNNPKQSGS
jgi:hypothetical protein